MCMQLLLVPKKYWLLSAGAVATARAVKAREATQRGRGRDSAAPARLNETHWTSPGTSELRNSWLRSTSQSLTVWSYDADASIALSSDQLRVQSVR